MMQSGPEEQQQPRDEGNPASDGPRVAPFRSDFTESAETPSRSDVAAPLCDDIACWKCDYDLRGISTEGVCPECGESAEATLVWRFRRTDPKWLKGVSNGMYHVVFGPVLMMALPCFVAHVPRFHSTLGESLAMGLMFSPLWFSAFGFSAITEPEPWEPKFASGRSWAPMLRKSARLILVSVLRFWLLLSWVPLVVGVAAAIAAAITGNPYTRSREAGGFALLCFGLLSVLVCLPLGVLGVFCLVRYEMHLAQRLDRQKLGTWLRRTGICAAVATAILLMTIAASFAVDREAILIGVAAWIVPAFVLFFAHIDLAKGMRRAAANALRYARRSHASAKTLELRSGDQ